MHQKDQIFIPKHLFSWTIIVAVMCIELAKQESMGMKEKKKSVSNSLVITAYYYKELCESPLILLGCYKHGTLIHSQASKTTNLMSCMHQQRCSTRMCFLCVFWLLRYSIHVLETIWQGEIKSSVQWLCHVGWGLIDERHVSPESWQYRAIGG